MRWNRPGFFVRLISSIYRNYLFENYTCVLESGVAVNNSTYLYHLQRNTSKSAFILGASMSDHSKIIKTLFSVCLSSLNSQSINVFLHLRRICLAIVAFVYFRPMYSSSSKKHPNLVSLEPKRPYRSSSPQSFMLAAAAVRSILVLKYVGCVAKALPRCSEAPS